jgi:hypothetical protein
MQSFQPVRDRRRQDKLHGHKRLDSIACLPAWSGDHTDRRACPDLHPNKKVRGHIAGGQRRGAVCHGLQLRGQRDIHDNRPHTRRRCVHARVIRPDKQRGCRHLYRPCRWRHLRHAFMDISGQGRDRGRAIRNCMDAFKIYGRHACRGYGLHKYRDRHSWLGTDSVRVDHRGHARDNHTEKRNRCIIVVRQQYHIYFIL